MEQKTISKENKMGVMPEGRLLLNMSLPMMISMLVQALYNIVDSIFVSRISEDALTAVSLAFPLQSLMIAIAAGTGVGVNALMSRALGEKNQDKVDTVVITSLTILDPLTAVQLSDNYENVLRIEDEGNSAEE